MECADPYPILWDVVQVFFNIYFLLSFKAHNEAIILRNRHWIRTPLSVRVLLPVITHFCASEHPARGRDFLPIAVVTVFSFCRLVNCCLCKKASFLCYFAIYEWAIPIRDVIPEFARINSTKAWCKRAPFFKPSYHYEWKNGDNGVCGRAMCAPQAFSFLRGAN